MPALLSEVYGMAFLQKVNKWDNEFQPTYTHYPQQEAMNEDEFRPFQKSSDINYHISLEEGSSTNNQNNQNNPNNQNNNNQTNNENKNNNALKNKSPASSNKKSSNNKQRKTLLREEEMQQYISQLEKRIGELEEELRQCRNKIGNTVYDILLYILSGIFLIYILHLFMKLGNM